MDFAMLVGAGGESQPLFFIRGRSPGMNLSRREDRQPGQVIPASRQIHKVGKMINGVINGAFPIDRQFDRVFGANFHTPAAPFAFSADPGMSILHGNSLNKAYILKAHPAANAFPVDRNIHAGHFRNGIVLGAASVEVMADIILGREPYCDAAPYRMNAVH
mgnify:CR=1 FL=1